MVRRLPIQVVQSTIHPPKLPRRGFSYYVFKDRSGYLWVSSNEETLDWFDPRDRNLYPLSNRPQRSEQSPRPVWHISQDRAGLLWLATSSGLHRLDPATGAFRHYSPDLSDRAV